MKIVDKRKQTTCFRDVQPGQVFVYHHVSGITEEDVYCMKMLGSSDCNAVALFTGMAMDFTDEEVTILEGEFVVKG